MCAWSEEELEEEFLCDEDDNCPWWTDRINRDERGVTDDVCENGEWCGEDWPEEEW